MFIAEGSHFTATAPSVFAPSSASSASARYGWTEAAHSKYRACFFAVSRV